MYTHRPIPPGVNQPLDSDRRPIWKVYAGDDMRMRMRIFLPWEPQTGASPENCNLSFALVDTRFTPADLRTWEGAWYVGISEVDPENHPGLVEFIIPKEISRQLRRGSFLYSVAIENKLGEWCSTIAEGTLLVEYSPTGPIHDIPYHDQDDSSSSTPTSPPSTSDGLTIQAAGEVDLDDGVDFVDVEGLGLSRAPVAAILTVMRDGVVDGVYFASYTNLSKNGFRAVISATISGSGYKLAYLVI